MEDTNVVAEKRWGDIILPSIILGLVPIVCAVAFIANQVLGVLVSAIFISVAFMLGMIEWGFAIMRIGCLENKKDAVLRLVGFLFVWSIGLGVAFWSCVYLENGVLIVMSIVFSVYVADAAGLVVGKFIVSKKIVDLFDWASSSRNKSVAGTLAYLIVAWVMLIFFAAIGFSTSLLTTDLLPLVMLFVVFAPPVGFMGDLYESSIKRKWDLKDSAEYAPWRSIWGRHGGCTDRLDSLVAISALPIILFMAALVCSVSMILNIYEY